MGTAVADQMQLVEKKFAQADHLESVAAHLRGSQPDDAAQLDQVATELIDEVGFVRVKVAAELLDVDVKTVTHWYDRGVFRSSRVDPCHPRVQTLDPIVVRAVYSIVRELRALGKANRQTLLEQVWHRLQDKAELESSDVQAGLAAWRAGDIVEA
ncbi:hypothetical protein [Kutzneria buriramensis]|uniref:Uncharacterized protein n=1 Tax=Kutzneria buriramensis TaxID=1045776 RepID=A0A3E0I8W8_9PSEU|nr:hypothetical protein [Kutzneria buriramensis]REH55218.1 hypothetical protein BCF44_101235 [Kutzneria buriramensis]